MNPDEHVTRDHWWWRPGWREGRSFFTWHITFPGHGLISQIVSKFAEAARRLDTLDLVSVDGIHLTVQGVGFTDEVSAEDLERICEAARSRCSDVPPIRANLGPPRVDEETVQMDVGPSSEILHLRRRIRSGIGDVWGPANVPESMDGFRPHITLAYSNGIARIDKINSVIGDLTAASSSVQISSVSLIRLNRDRKRYEWSEVAKVFLGG
jgi:2'-5' RNA ligase